MRSNRTSQVCDSQWYISPCPCNTMQVAKLISDLWGVWMPLGGRAGVPLLDPTSCEPRAGLA